MSKKKARKARFAAEPAQMTVGPEIRRLMRKFGLTEEETLSMMRECNAALDGVDTAMPRIQAVPGPCR